jgi:hypothetical protein
MSHQDETSLARVSYDERTRTVTVMFSGKRHVVPGRYPTLVAGMRAGNDFYRRQGWPYRS